MRELALVMLSTSVFALSMAIAPASPSWAETQQNADDSGTMEKADADMRDVLKKFGELGPKPLESLTPEEARKQPTPADAVAALLKDQGKDPEMMKKQSGVTSQDLTGPRFPALRV